jgi:signal transduction histidine kinase
MRARSRAEAVDWVLAVVSVPCLLVQVLVLDFGSPTAGAAIAGSVVCAGLAFRRRFPALVGIGTQAVLSGVRPWVLLPAGPVTVAWFCALYALTVWTGRKTFAVGLAFVVVANGASSIHHLSDPGPGAQFGIAAAGIMALVRIVVGGRDRQLQLAGRERDVAAREAVVEERERIARELHDVIAHHVSTMVVQAGAERRMLGDDQAETRDVLSTIERVGRGALTEMRRMVSMLRQDAERDLAPQPRLADVPDLVRQMQAAGLAVSLEVTGEPAPLPEGIELSAYRIVQEALTNALKHAHGAHASVYIRHDHETLDLVVRDDGMGERTTLDRGGHGLVGMRERVAMYGGTFEAGPERPVGFAVRVRLPVR